MTSEIWAERSKMPLWTGNRWVDWEHTQTLDRAIHRMWPKNVTHVLDVGAGNGEWSRWMAAMFNCKVHGIDMFPSGPGIEQAKAEQSAKVFYSLGPPPQLITVINALGCFEDWVGAVGQFRRCNVPVLVADNTQQPTPPWYQNLPYRRHIEFDLQRAVFIENGFRLKKAIAVDILYRTWLEHTPKWSHPVVAGASVLVDLATQYLIKPQSGRHSISLFVPR